MQVSCIYFRHCHKLATVKTGTALRELTFRHDHSHSTPALVISSLAVPHLDALLCWLATRIDFSMTYEICQICLMLLCWWLIISFSWLLDQSLDLTILETVPKPWGLLSAQSIVEQIYGCLSATRFAEKSGLHHNENCSIYLSAEVTIGSGTAEERLGYETRILQLKGASNASQEL